MRKSSWKSRGLVVAGLVLALPAQAALIVTLAYDSDLDITWAGDANLAKMSGFDSDGLMTWSVANAWATGLTLGGVSGWRLPTCRDNAVSSASCSTSEMAHLFTGEGISSGSQAPLATCSPASIGRVRSLRLVLATRGSSTSTTVT